MIVSKINTLGIELELSKRYKYKPLPRDLSEKYQQLYLENIPEFLNVNGGDIILKTPKGKIICNGYERIVIGDYGAFVEFDETQANVKEL